MRKMFSPSKLLVTYVGTLRTVNLWKQHVKLLKQLWRVYMDSFFVSVRLVHMSSSGAVLTSDIIM